MSSFSSAFAAARKAGKKEFTWNGKRYHTRLAKETPKKGPVPKARPSNKKAEKKVPTPTKRPQRDSGTKAQAKVPKNAPKPKERPMTDAEVAKVNRKGPSKRLGIRAWKPDFEFGPIKIGGDPAAYRKYRRQKAKRER